MSFAHRIHLARSAEKQVLEELRATNWKVFEFGQALLPIEFRDALKEYQDSYGNPSLVRWFPDLIVKRRAATLKMRVILLDVKSVSTIYPNHSIETKALEAAEAFQAAFFTPCWFIWPGLTVATPEMVRANCWDGHQRMLSSGSGTPFKLILKDVAKPLDQVFAALT
jgi:hypothetical protein